MNTIPFAFKYHPKSFDEMILTPKIKDQLQHVYDNITNCVLAGPPGVGKSTFVDILSKHHKLNILRINASDETGIDAMRDKVKTFAYGVNLEDKPKLVYLNECDSLSVPAQKMLRFLIEQVIDITRFILVCNYPEKIIPELFSRCPLIMIENPPIKDLALKCIRILDTENIKYDKKTVIHLVKATGTDVRHCLNTMEMNIIDGKLLDDITVRSTNETYDGILAAMKTGDPSQVRIALRSGAIDYVRLYNYLYEKVMDSEEEIFKNDMSALLHITEASYRTEFVSIKEINFMNMYLKMVKEGVV